MTQLIVQTDALCIGRGWQHFLIQHGTGWKLKTSKRDRIQPSCYLLQVWCSPDCLLMCQRLLWADAAGSWLILFHSSCFTEADHFNSICSESTGDLRGSTPSPPLVKEDGQHRWCPDGKVHVGPETAGILLPGRPSRAGGGEAQRYPTPYQG